jgi:Flp pilus assembly protein TadG
MARRFKWGVLQEMSSYKESDRGNTTIVFAFSAVALMAAAGAALDFNQMESAKTNLNAAADAAILAAVKTADYSYANGSASWQPLGVSAGNAAFQKNLPDNMKNATIALNITHTGNVFTGDGTYAWDYPTSFMGMFGIPNLTITRTVAAGEKIQNYLDVHLLIDVSPSMGIGATDADQTTLYNAMGCAVACHYSVQNGIGDNTAPARATGAQLRVDVVRAATQKLINDIKTRAVSSDQVRISIDLYSNQLIPLFAPSTDLVAAATAANGIDLTDAVYNSGTDTTYALKQLALKIAPSGNGYGPNNRKSYVVLVSDGTENSVYATPTATPGVTGRIMDPNFVVNPLHLTFNQNETNQTILGADCDGIKAAGHTMLTGHLDYLVPNNNNGGNDARFNFIASNLIQASITEFKSCASDPSLAYGAKTPADIGVMYDNILNDILPPSNIVLTK